MPPFILDEEPATLLRGTVTNFGIQSDLATISRANEQLASLAKERESDLDKARGVLRSLSRSLEVAKTSAEAAQRAAAKKEHSATMINLDRDKFALAKNINELESNSHNLEGTLARLKEELESLDSESPMQSTQAHPEDETLLRLKVYRSLGITLEEDGAGGYSKAVIHNSKRGDVHVLKFDKKFKRTFYTNYFWNSI